MEREYAQALFNLSKKPGTSADALIGTLITHLHETGREKILPRILLELKRLNARNSSFGELLEVASAEEKLSAQKAAKEFGITATPVVNESLVSGWRARSGSRLIDQSGKRALIDLYRAIAASA